MEGALASETCKDVDPYKVDTRLRKFKEVI